MRPLIHAQAPVNMHVHSRAPTQLSADEFAGAEKAAFLGHPRLTSLADILRSQTRRRKAQKRSAISMIYCAPSLSKRWETGRKKTIHVGT